MMELQLKINKVEFDRVQAIHRYYMGSDIADVIIELPRTFKKLTAGSEGRIFLLRPEDAETRCENGLLLLGRVLSLKDEKEAILSFGGLIVKITLKKGTLPAISEGSAICLCVTGFET